MPFSHRFYADDLVPAVNAGGIPGAVIVAPRNAPQFRRPPWQGTT
jgi:hypothetical protein